MVALDVNKDGVIDAAEIANSSAVLLTLDKNSDGKLGKDEMHPARPAGAPPEGGKKDGQGGPGAGPAGGPDGGPGRNRPMPPMIAALDANQDGEIDGSEIANAPAALKTLDKNGDGQLTQDELRPARPEGAPQDGGAQQGHRKPRPQQ
jgi:Ca2+-binding EF-hand superfamily protein